MPTAKYRPCLQHIGGRDDICPWCRITELEEAGEMTLGRLWHTLGERKARAQFPELVKTLRGEANSDEAD